jgi:hypothetical protein
MNSSNKNYRENLQMIANQKLARIIIKANFSFI